MLFIDPLVYGNCHQVSALLLLMLAKIIARWTSLQLFAYDTVKKQLTPDPGKQPKLPIPASSIAGAVAGVSSTLCTYPLELLKTRVTVQVNSSFELLMKSFTCLIALLMALILLTAERSIQESLRCIRNNYTGGRTCRAIQRPYS